MDNSILRSLPTEALLIIFNFTTNLPSLISLSLTCKEIREILISGYSTYLPITHINPSFLAFFTKLRVDQITVSNSTNINTNIIGRFNDCLIYSYEEMRRFIRKIESPLSSFTNIKMSLVSLSLNFTIWKKGDCCDINIHDLPIYTKTLGVFEQVYHLLLSHDIKLNTININISLLQRNTPLIDYIEALSPREGIKTITIPSFYSVDHLVKHSTVNDGDEDLEILITTRYYIKDFVKHIVDMKETFMWDILFTKESEMITIDHLIEYLISSDEPSKSQYLKIYVSREQKKKLQESITGMTHILHYDEKKFLDESSNRYLREKWKGNKSTALKNINMLLIDI
jgi:hypothetical protein